MTKNALRPSGAEIISKIKIEVLPISTSQVFYAICDWKSLSLFDALVYKDGGSKELIVKLRMSRKEYYSRISKLVDTGLVRKKGRKYTITVFGKVIYEARVILAKTLAIHHKQRARENQLTLVDPDDMQVILKSR
jgi:hypothetical protein